MTAVAERKRERTPARGSSSSNPIRVFLVDDHELVREGLISLLRREPDLSVVGQAATGREAIESIPAADPDVVILDYRLPDMSGLEICREIAERRLRARVVVLSGFLHDQAVHESLMAGACAYVVKDVEARELRQAIRIVARGGMLIDPQVAGHMLSWAARQYPNKSGLSPSLLTVLRLLGQGKTNAQIAEAMGLTLLTVKTYVSRIYRQLGVNGRAEASAEALRRGLLSDRFSP